MSVGFLGLVFPIQGRIASMRERRAQSANACGGLGPLPRACLQMIT